jgi:VanZ family protein
MSTVYRWGPALVWMAVIFMLSAQSGLRVTEDAAVDLPIRHVAHMLSYGLLAALLLYGLSWHQPQRWNSRLAGLAVILATLYGVTDELHQRFVPGRTGNLVDIGWDFLGAMLGVTLVRFLPNLRRRWRLRAERRRASAGGSAVKRG